MGDASSEVSAARMRQFDLYCRLRCEKDSETGVTASRLLKLKQGLAEAGVLRPFPVTLAIARALPSCGVPPRLGIFLSLAVTWCHTMDWSWITTAIVRCLFTNLRAPLPGPSLLKFPNFLGRPVSPDARSRHSGNSYGTNDHRAPGGSSFITENSQDWPQDQRNRSRSRSSRRRRDRSCDSREC